MRGAGLAAFPPLSLGGCCRRKRTTPTAPHCAGPPSRTRAASHAAHVHTPHPPTAPRRVPCVQRRDVGPRWLSRSPRRLRFSAAVAACLVPVGRRSSRRAACRCCALASRRPGAASAPFRRAHTTRRDGQRAGRACGTPDQPRTTARHQQRPLGESRESTCESRESREFACGGRANCANFRFANTRGIHGNTRGIHEIHVFCFFIYLIHVYDSGDSGDSGDSPPPSAAEAQPPPRLGFLRPELWFRRPRWVSVEATQKHPAEILLARQGRAGGGRSRQRRATAGMGNQSRNQETAVP
jgi:hypothetical protein